MGDKGRKLKNCWQDVGKKPPNPVGNWRGKLTKESDIGELIDNNGAKIAQFLAGMQAIQKGRNSILYCAFCSFGCLGSLATLLLGRLDWWLSHWWSSVNGRGGCSWLVRVPCVKGPDWFSKVLYCRCGLPSIFFLAIAFSWDLIIEFW